MVRLSKSQIQSVDDLAREEVPIPEWKGSVLVQSLTAAQRDRWDQQITELGAENEPIENIRAAFAVIVCVDDDGQPMFKTEDIDWLGKKNGAALDRIWDVGRRISGMGRRSLEDAKGNSEPDQTADSAST